MNYPWKDVECYYRKISKGEYVSIEEFTSKGKIVIKKRSGIIGKTLTQMRLSIGCTQREISEMACIAQPTYAGYERGTHEPTIEVLIRLAEIYCVSLDYLTGRIDSTPNECKRNEILREATELNECHELDILSLEIERRRERETEQREYNRARKPSKKNG